MKDNISVVRVTNHLPSISRIGVGQPVFFQSKFSKLDNYIIKNKQEDCYYPIERSKVHEVFFKNKDLGSTKSKKKFSYFLSLLHNIYNQLVFFSLSLSFLENIKPDIMHVYSPIFLIFGVYSKLRFKTRVVLSFHGTDILRTNLINKLSWIINRYCDEIWTLNIHMSDYLDENTNLKNTIPMKNGYDNEIYYNKSNIRKKQFIHIGKLSWRKNQKFLLEVFSNLITLDLFSDYLLLVIGSGELENDLRMQSDHLGISNKVLFLGSLEPKVISEHLSESFAMLLGSLIEGFPKVVLESFAEGTPVIANRSSNMGFILNELGLETSDNSILDYLDIASNLTNLDFFESIQSKIIEISKSYTWEEVTMFYDNAYLNMIEKKNA